MRNMFAKALFEMLENERKQSIDKTYLLTGDLGFSVFDKLREAYSERIINMGVSEQNMIGVSAGMALMGKDVFVYSIIPFLLYRPFEQIRNDICYHNLKVRLVGMGANLAYANAGATHQPFEDLRIADALPNLTILSPSDPNEVEKFMHEINSIKGPVYMRLAKSTEQFHNMHKSIQIGKVLKLTEGDEILIIVTGALAGIAVEATKRLNAENKNTVEVLEVHTFKPFDYDGIVASAEGKKIIVTVEDSSGALAEKVSSALIGKGRQKFISFKLPDKFTDVSGSKEYLLERYGISVSNIYKAIKNAEK